jgi:hypothetical protein
MRLDDFTKRRESWIQYVAGRVCPDSLGERIDGFEALNIVERGLVTVHIGLAHLLGVSDEDASLPNYVSTASTTEVISRWWRSGNADALTTSALYPTWVALFQLSRDLRLSHTDLLHTVATSQTGRKVAEFSTQDLSLVIRSPLGLTELLERAAGEPIEASSFAEGSFQWDCSGSHLAAVRRLIQNFGVREVGSVLTLQEIAAALPSDEDDRWNLRSLEQAAHLKHVYLSMPGGWAGPSEDDVPDWVRDIVTTRGAQSYFASSGLIPGWLFVANSDEELQAANRWSYEGGVGFDHLLQDRLKFLIRFEFGPEDYGWISYEYLLNDLEQVNWARTILAVGFVRFELYKLGLFNELKFVASFGVVLPPGLVESAKLHLIERLPPDREISVFSSGVVDDRLKFAAQTERTFFENLGLCVPELASGSDLGIAYGAYLRALDAATKTRFRGSWDDHRNLIESKELLQSAISKHPRHQLEPLPIGSLGVGRAPGIAESESFEFSGLFDPGYTAGSFGELCQYLSTALAPLRSLQGIGVQKIVISAGAGVYNLPFHEALMALGFIEASYCHRVATLSSFSPANGHCADGIVAGFAGVDGERIASVDVELAIVGELLSTDRTSLNMDRLPSIVHLAGHAKTGRSDLEIGLLLGPDKGHVLTSSEVLLNADATATELVFLSACSTGAGLFSIGELIGAVPLDVAFIEKGARVVVSTAAPVNDQVACFFACVFHEQIALGSSYWASYIATREAMRSRVLPPNSTRLSVLLAKYWLTWHDDLDNQSILNPDDWRLFRLSGRVWD